MHDNNPALLLLVKNTIAAIDARSDVAPMFGEIASTLIFTVDKADPATIKITGRRPDGVEVVGRAGFDSQMASFMRARAEVVTKILEYRAP